MFSAKESVYKAWFPLTRRWLGFEDADIVFDSVNGTFDARLVVENVKVDSSPLSGFSGRWLASDGLLLTVIVVPARRPHELQ